MEEFPFLLINDIERTLAADPLFRQGLDYGRPRRGHPEGAIKYHIAAVIKNIDSWYAPSPYYLSLRLVALIHDTFKFQVDTTKQRSGPNHHGAYARRFAEQYITDDAVLDIIELHDEAYNAWGAGDRRGNWKTATKRATRLIERLGNKLDLYRAFYRCDNETGDKSQVGREWFEELITKTT